MQIARLVRGALLAATVSAASMIGTFWAATASAAAPLELLVPAYFYPEGKGLKHWNNLASAARKAPVTAILNPNDGPGTAVDPAYTSVTRNARASGAKLIGYVFTLYGQRPLADVIADIHRYLDFYTVDGFFFDEMADDGSSATINYYSSIYQYVKGLNTGFRVVMNPGTGTPESYASLPLADTLVTFEDGPRPYRRLQVSAWWTHYGNDRFAHMLHDVGTLGSAVSFVGLAAQRNAASIYITNDRIAGNPWDALPGYWSGLVSEVCRRNGGTGC